MGAVKLDEVAQVNPRLTDLVAPETVISFIGMSDVDEQAGSTATGHDRPFSEVANGYTQFRDKDLLVAKITPCFENGKIAQASLSRARGAGSTEFHVIRPDNSRLDHRYLLHYLRQPWVRIVGERRMVGSAGHRRIPEQFISDLDIPLPSLARQREVARALDRADALRTRRREVITLLDDLAQSIFLDMFGTPATNPHGWPKMTLGEVIMNGPQNGLYKAASHYGSGVPIVRIDAFYEGVISKVDSLKRVRLTDAELNKFALSPGDVLINRVNSIEYLGKSALVPNLAEATVYESNMMRFRVDERTLAPRFLVRLLQSRFVKLQILRSAKNAVNQSSINQKDVCSLRVYVPPIELQQEYVAKVEAIEQRKATAMNHLTHLDELFGSLQQRAFRGELWED